MGVLKLCAWLGLCLALSGCQISYLIKSAYNQMSMLNSGIPIEKALADPDLTPDQKHKLELSIKARAFAEKDLSLKSTKNYTSFVKLNRNYVTYVVSASPKWKLEHYEWYYPIVGKMPYKGFFNEEDAKEEQAELKKKDLDTYLRGVSAYSTLGWFQDPLLSSMLRYEDFDLVNTIIHETVHATIFIKHAADFNERLATYLGNKGAELYYLKEEGPESLTLKKIKDENHDNKIFSVFISKEIESLKDWYSQIKENEHDEQKRLARIQEIKTRFVADIAPQLKSDEYARFPTADLNNARLLLYSTYMQDLNDFDELFELVGHRFPDFINECRGLEKSKTPEQDLKGLIEKLKRLKGEHVESSLPRGYKLGDRD